MSAVLTNTISLPALGTDMYGDLLRMTYANLHLCVF